MPLRIIIPLVTQQFIGFQKENMATPHEVANRQGTKSRWLSPVPGYAITSIKSKSKTAFPCLELSSCKHTRI